MGLFQGPPGIVVLWAPVAGRKSTRELCQLFVLAASRSSPVHIWFINEKNKDNYNNILDTGTRGVHCIEVYFLPKQYLL